VSDNEIIYRLDRIIDLLTAINERLTKGYVDAVRNVSISEVKEFRKANNISQAELGRMIGISQQAINQFEKGQTGLRTDTMNKLLYVVRI
jgi:DNA-binding XRE family transcriptional regulator